MSAEAYWDEEMYQEAEPNVISIKRNPYLEDYDQQRRMREHRISHGQDAQRSARRMERQDGLSRSSQRMPRQGQGMERQEMRRPPQGQRMGQRDEMHRPSQGQRMERQQETRRVSQGQGMERQEMRRVSQGQGMTRQDGLSRSSQRMPRQGQGMERQEMRRPPQGQRMGQRDEMHRPSQGQRMERQQETRRVSQDRGMERQEMRRPSQRKYAPQAEPMERRDRDLFSDDILAQNRRAAIERKRAALHRRRVVKMQRMMMLAGIFCITLLCGILYLKRMYVKADEPDNRGFQGNNTIADTQQDTSQSGLVQGLPAAEFAKHPEWEEKFLTPNEYSRPGESLEEVNSIFVHYTANPNTSAAQNRSYFEQLKDTHITSASAHFIIGYNGEIIQCIPLDEIAYAVQTRNYDSVSIECCYKSADGSFTQETYDSLIGLLAWLTDTYDLTTDDILRHYDCGGKKCPIYYTEHEDAWTRLKSDVAEKL